MGGGDWREEELIEWEGRRLGEEEGEGLEEGREGSGEKEGGRVGGDEGEGNVTPIRQSTLMWLRNICWYAQAAALRKPLQALP